MRHLGLGYFCRVWVWPLLFSMVFMLQRDAIGQRVGASALSVRDSDDKRSRIFSQCCVIVPFQGGARTVKISDYIPVWIICFLTKQFQPINPQAQLSLTCSVGATLCFWKIKSRIKTPKPKKERTNILPVFRMYIVKAAEWIIVFLLEENKRHGQANGFVSAEHSGKEESLARCRWPLLGVLLGR